MSRRKLHADDYDDGFDDYDPRDYEQTSLHGSGGTELEPPPEGYHSDLRTVKAGSHVAGCFTEDGQWYPAVVGEVIPIGATVWRVPCPTPSPWTDATRPRAQQGRS